MMMELVKTQEQKEVPKTSKQPISFCMIMGENDTYLETLKSVLPFTNDIILYVQANKEFYLKVLSETRELFAGKRSIIKQRPVLGNSETDRNDITKLCKNKWILQLDSDEILVIEHPPQFYEMLEAFHAIWIPFFHYVNGRLLGFMSPDFHPRLYQNGAVIWSGNVHSYPRVYGNEIVPFADIIKVNHFRTFSTLLASHKKRRHLLRGNELQLENNFLRAVVKILKSEAVLNERDRKTVIQLLQS